MSDPVVAAPSTKAVRSKPRRFPVRGLVTIVIVVAAVLAVLAEKQTILGAYNQLAGETSPVLASAAKVGVPLGATPTATPTIETKRVQITVPGTGTQEVRIPLKKGDQLVGIYDAAD